MTDIKRKAPVKVRCAEAADLVPLQKFFRQAAGEVAEGMKCLPNGSKGIYPSAQMIEDAVRHHKVFIALGENLPEEFHTSDGYIMGGSGGHSDTAAGAKLSMIIAPMFRARLPIVTDKVTCISTPGKDIDVLVTQGGIAVNPAKAELRDRLVAAGLPVVDIHQLKEKTERITGTPPKTASARRTVATAIYRDGTQIDEIRQVGK